MTGNDKLIYLTEALVMIAIKSPAGALRGTEVCGQLGLPPRYLEPELQNLVRAGVLKSIRGPNGGYVLAREKRNVNLQDLSKALVSQKPQGKFSELANRVIIKSLEQAEAGMAKVTLHDIIKNAATLGLAKPPESTDFTI